MTKHDASQPIISMKPAFYGDTGGPGWFAELQFPHRRRLEYGYSTEKRREVYYRPCEITIRAGQTASEAEVRKIFATFNIVSIEYMGPPSSELINGGAMIVLFDSPEMGSAALKHAASIKLKCYRSEVNTTGRHAWTLTDIKLVREEDRGVNRITIPTPTGSDAKAPTKRSRSEDLVEFDNLNLSESPDDTITPSPPKRRCDSPGRGASRITPNTTPTTTRLPETAVSPNVNTFTSSSSSTMVLARDPRIQTPSQPPDQAGLPFTPPPSATSASSERHFEHLEDYQDSLQLSSHPAYLGDPLPRCPQWFAMVDGSLVISLSADMIRAKHPAAKPIHIDDLPEKVRNHLGLQRIEGYRWKVKYETQEKWRSNRGFLELTRAEQ